MTPRLADPFVVRRAAVSDVALIAPLFDSYREFYERSRDLGAASTFLHDRLQAGDAVIFVAAGGGHAQSALGFVQLYPTFTSVDLGRLWLLNDLYVAEAARGRGVARALLNAAIDHARASGAVRLQLETMEDNARARAVYEAGGWVQIAGSCFYNYWLNAPRRALTSGNA
jgi:ribosomal protein S18 acetylase RimI-like enzyme